MIITNHDDRILRLMDGTEGYRVLEKISLKDGKEPHSIKIRLSPEEQEALAEALNSGGNK